MPVTWTDLAVSVTFNVAICVVCFVAFSILRRVPILYEFYNGKRYLSIPFRFRPAKLPRGLFTWVKPVLKLPDAHIAATAGFDALAYIRFLRLCVTLSGYISMFVLLSVLPTNWIGGDYVSERLDEQGSDGSECSSTSAQGTAAAATAAGGASRRCSGLIVTSFDRTSLTNINPGSNLMIVHLVALYIITLFVLKNLWEFYRESVRWRVLYLAWLHKGDVAHTVYVHDIPGTPQGTILGRLYDASFGTLGMFLPKAAKASLDRLMQHSSHAAAHVRSASKAKLPKKLHPVFRDGAFETYTAVVDEAPKTSPDRDGPTADLRCTVHVNKLAARAALHSGDASRAPDADLDGHVRENHDPAHWSARPAGTDFEVWRQAEAAYQRGVSMRDLVTREFTRTFGAAELEYVSVVHNDWDLRSLFAKYEKRKAALERLQDRWAARLRRRQAVKQRSRAVRTRSNASAAARFGANTEKAGEMEVMMWELDELLLAIREKQAEAEKREASAAFVTMRSRLAQTVAASGLMSFDETQWVTRPAPAPEEVIWDNIALRGWERGVRQLASWGAFALLILTFIPIVSGVQSAVNLSEYSDSELVAKITSLPIVEGLITSVGSTIVFKIFLKLVPILFTLASRFLTAVPSLSALDREVAVKLFGFLFVVHFVFNTVIGLVGGTRGDDSNAVVSFIDFVQEEGFGEVLNLLGSALPQQAPFFIFFILTDALFATSLQFLRIPGATIYLVMSRMAAGYRQRKQLWSRNVHYYGRDVPGHTITLLLMLTFAVVQPLLPVVAFAYFLVTHLYARYTLLYTRREAYQSGGLLWPVIFEQVIVAVTTALLGNLALFAVKRFAYAALVLPLLGIVAIFRIRIGELFGRPMTVISAHAAADLDRNDKVYDWYRDISAAEVAEMERRNWDLGDMRLGAVHERYVQRTLLRDDAGHARLLQDSRDLLRRVAAFEAGDSSALHDEEFMNGGQAPQGEYKPTPGSFDSACIVHTSSTSPSTQDASAAV